MPESESHHLLHVLRVRKGDAVTVFDGRGRMQNAIAGSVSDNGLLELHPSGPPEECTPEPKVAVDMVLALPREQKLDWVLQKATELRAAAIHPVFTRNSLIRLDASRETRKMKRWQSIIINAAKQSGNLRPPTLHYPKQFGEWLASTPTYDLLLLGSLDPAAEPLHTLLPTLSPQRVALLIGPEGDFTAEERAAARRFGAVDISFGPVVLRTDTAALFGLSVLRYAWGLD